MRERWASLISGGGTTMQEMVSACQSGRVPMEIACIIVSNQEAGGIEKAMRLGIPGKDIVVVDPNNFRDGDGMVDQESFGNALLKELRPRGVTVVTQNGWLPLTPPHVISEFSGVIFNQHPGPVPEFGGKSMYGKRVHAARLGFAQRVGRDFWTEAIAQRVAVDFDQGAVVRSERVDILSGDTAEVLQQRVLPVEHRVQIALLQDVARGNVRELGSREVLVRPGEEGILFDAKREARRLYPNG